MKSGLKKKWKEIEPTLMINLKNNYVYKWPSKQTLAFRKGRTSASSATARKLAVIIWNMITKKVPYKTDSQYEFLDQKRKRKVMEIKKLISLISHLTTSVCNSISTTCETLVRIGARTFPEFRKWDFKQFYHYSFSHRARGHFWLVAFVMLRI